MASTAIGRALDRIQAEGRRVHGALDRDGTDLRAGLEAGFARRLDGLGLAADSAEAQDLLARVDAAGLYLAAACETGQERAWEVLTRTYAPRLVGLAVRRGLAPSTAAELADEVLGALALPPPRGGSRTRLGTYLGASTLFGWLATILVRRIADLARRRRPASLDADPQTTASVPAGGEDDPASSAQARESADQAAAALTRAWPDLTPRERLVLALKFCDGLTQRAAARILGVGEPRVSRLVGQALAKLETSLGASVGSIDDEAWPAMQDAIRRRLATLAADVRPPAEGQPPTGARHER